jgi:colicin import membrane protein
MEAMMEQQLAAEANARSQAASAAAKGEVDKYAALIKATVERYMILDPTMRGKTCTIGVKLASTASSSRWTTVRVTRRSAAPARRRC